MYRVAREIEFCYGHRLLNYDGKCRHLHGHNGRAVVTLEGERLDERGMLVDFGEIKKTVQRWIDEEIDHNMLLCRDDPLLPMLVERGERVFVMDANPTAENIAVTFWRILEPRISSGTLHSIKLYESDNNFVEYFGEPVEIARYDAAAEEARR